jgi:hypothetical protein
MSATVAGATDVRIGGALGYGGTGLTKEVTVNGSSVTAKRSEGPGMGSLFADFLITNRFSLAVDLEWGYRIGPLSSGAQLLGWTGRYYFLGPSPESNLNTETTLFIKRYSPFIGISNGIAALDITRTNDQVQEVRASGMYIGTKIGFDYPLNYKFGIRPEIMYAFTFYSQETPAATVTAFAAQFGLYYWL